MLNGLLHKFNRKILAYKSVFLDGSGNPGPLAEIVLKDLARFCHIKTSTFIQGDSHYSAYYEGQRSVLLYIYKMLRQDPKLLEQETEYDD